MDSEFVAPLSHRHKYEICCLPSKKKGGGRTALRRSALATPLQLPQYCLCAGEAIHTRWCIVEFLPPDRYRRAETNQANFISCKTSTARIASADHVVFSQVFEQTRQASLNLMYGSWCSPVWAWTWSLTQDFTAGVIRSATLLQILPPSWFLADFLGFKHHQGR